MSVKPKIVVFAGSTREGSLNKKLARVAAAALRQAGADATFLDLRDYPMVSSSRCSGPTTAC
jgi:chromate reductase, NAD(P)H dehydrogenase (quinone)